MPRPRFHKLPELQQNAIVDAALEEFATHGYRDASLNHIIATAGISKGSMYYYFDGKEDLYAHTIRTQVELMLEEAGPFPVPEAVDTDGFWTILEDYYRRVLQTLNAFPRLATLLRGWLSSRFAPKLDAAQKDAEQQMLPWMRQTMAAGQRIGAVRTDVPTDLLITIAMSMGEAMDIWLVTAALDGVELDGYVHSLLAMLRRAISVD